MPYFKNDQTKLHYETTGSGSRVVIFIHGNFASWRWWAPQLSSLPTGYTAYALDLRGCGDSDQPATGYEIDSLIDDLASFVDQMALDRFHLVGHSLGGALVQEFCYRFPEKVISLTLVAPVPASGLVKLQNREPPSFIGQYFSPDRLFSAISTLKMKKPLLRLGFQKSMPGSEHWSDFEALINSAANMSPAAFGGFLELLSTWRNPAPEQTRCPVLIVHGMLDTAIPANELILMEKQFPNCHRACWSMVGHAPQLEQPKTFSSLLYNFIETVEEPKGKALFSPPIEKTKITPTVKTKPIGQRLLQWLKQLFKKTD